MLQPVQKVVHYRPVLVIQAERETELSKEDTTGRFNLISFNYALLRIMSEDGVIWEEQKPGSPWCNSGVKVIGVDETIEK